MEAEVRKGKKPVDIRKLAYDKISTGVSDLATGSFVSSLRKLDKSIQDIEELSKPPRFYYDFYLIGPVLDGYRYKLFTIGNSIDLYPVVFFLDDEIRSELLNEESGKRIVAESEEEFMEILRRILNSKKTVRVINAILAQSGYEPTIEIK